MKRGWLLVGVCCALWAGAGQLRGQEPQQAGPATALRVFIDCNDFRACDSDFMRSELGWVSHMRDRTDAQVHVLVTTQGTGGGGSRYTVAFIGLKEFEGRADTLSYTASADATDDLRRRGLTQTIRLGLVGFVARTPAGQQLAIGTLPPPPGGPPGVRGPGGPGAPPGSAPEHDPWDFWTFTLSLNGNGNGESSTKYYSVNGSVTANRTTEDWKINTRLSGNQRQNTFEYDIPDPVTGDPVHKKTVSTYENYGLNTLMVKSLGPHLSAGGSASASRSTYGNTSLGLSMAPAIEYNFFPYSESTRRQLLLRYSTGLRYADYREITIFGETRETRPNHELEAEYSTTQPWGQMYVSASASQYLHDRSKYNAGLFASTNVRLFKGFSFNVAGNYNLVRDQLSLPGRDLTEEEILLQQRQQATNYSYFISAGISYRFGSIFNNVVNPRMGGSGGGGSIIIMH